MAAPRHRISADDSCPIYAAAALFAALAARARAKFASNAAFRAGDIFFFAGAVAAAFCALWIAAHRFFVAAMIAALPAALNLRLALGEATGVDGPAAFFDSAHRFR